MMKRELLNRVKALEVRFIPPEPWRITAQFAELSLATCESWIAGLQWSSS